MDQELFYKILEVEEWQDFQQSKVFQGTALDKRDGYIHMSQFKDQMLRVKDKYYKNKAIYLLQIDSKKLSNVKFEPASNGDLYPHEYGNLNFDCVVDSELLEG